MKKFFVSGILVVGLLGIASTGEAPVGLLGIASTADDPVQYVRICSLYGAAFHYIPGTDICLNEETGETREETGGGTWVSLLPTNNQGHWVAIPREECGGKLVKVGTFKPRDFRLNSFEKYQAEPFELKLQQGEFISKVMMSGGFYDPLQPLARGPQLSSEQFCLRVADPNFFTIDMGSAPIYPPFCSAAPLGCVSNSEILGTRAAYWFTVLGAPVVHYNTDSTGKVIGSPMTCGSQLVVTTGMGSYDPAETSDPSQPGVPIPAAGTLSVWACVEPR